MSGGALITRMLRPVIARETAKAAVQAAPLPVGFLEAAAGASLAALTYRFGASPELLAFGALAVLGVVLAALDHATRCLPNRLIGATYVAVFLPLITDVVVTGDLGQLGRALLSALSVLLAHALLYGFGGLGGGDLKLVGVLAAALGWINWQAVVTGLGIGWALAVVYVIITLIVPRKLRRPDIALGPFLITGTLITAISGAAT